MSFLKYIQRYCYHFFYRENENWNNWNVFQHTKDTFIENEMILRINLAYYSLIYLITSEWKDTLDLLVYCSPQPKNIFTLISPCYFSCLFWNWKHLLILSLQNTDWCQSRSHLGHSNKVHGSATELIACCIWYFWSKSKAIPGPRCLTTSLIHFRSLSLWFCAHYQGNTYSSRKHLDLRVGFQLLSDLI